MRFPEFGGEWEECKLEDCVDFLDGLRKPIKSEERKCEKGLYPYYGASGIIDYIDEYIFDGDYILLSEDGANILDRNYRVAFLAKGKIWVNNHAHVLLPHTNIDIDFLSEALERLNYAVYNTGTTMPKLNQEICRKIGLHIPSTKEQNKIGALLSLLNERIATQNKVIEDLKKLKSAIIEEHYKQSEKQSVPVADLGEPFSVSNLSKEDLTDTGTPCVIYGELFTTYGEIINHVESYTKRSKGMTLSKKGDLLFPSSTTVDAVSLIAPSNINVDNVILGGDMFGIHISSNYDAQYLSYYFNHIAKKQLAKYAKGSTIIHLHYKEIEKVNLLLPCLIEQNKIAHNLILLDEKIHNENAHLQLIVKQKQYMLRHMFI